MDIILYLLQLCHQLYQQNCWLINFICRYIPLKQWAFDDSHSPKYQKFKVDQLPRIVYHHQEWDWMDLNKYYTWKYGKPVQPVRRRSECDIPEECTCPACNAPQPYLYRNGLYQYHGVRRRRRSLSLRIRFLRPQCAGLAEGAPYSPGKTPAWSSVLRSERYFLP